MTSERAFQLQNDAVRIAIRSSLDLGLGRPVYHSGLKAGTMPDATDWGFTAHDVRATLDVTVNLECGGAAITEAMISAALMSLVNAAVPDGRVWDQLKIATSDKEAKAFYASDEDGKPYNAWMIHRIDFDSLFGGGIDDDPVADVHTFELRHIRAHDK